jgi:hypothetical protein
MIAHGHLILICLRVGNINEADTVVKGTNGEAFGVGKGKGRRPSPLPIEGIRIRLTRGTIVVAAGKQKRNCNKAEK